MTPTISILTDEYFRSERADDGVNRDPLAIDGCLYDTRPTVECEGDLEALVVSFWPKATAEAEAENLLPKIRGVFLCFHDGQWEAFKAYVDARIAEIEKRS